MSDKKILFSGIQPTGDLHIGNYLGALKNWVDLQDQHDCFYSIVDLHAITVDYDQVSYQEQILNTAIDLLAIGIDPKKSTLFVQSKVTQHTELTWLFNTLVPMAELQRMTQFKDKSRQNFTNINMGLFDYPVLQTADILLYKGELVPVGEDQLQHLELANTILRKFNNKFGEYFQKIDPIVSKSARVMSLQEPQNKMSKSLGASNYIALRDDADTIRKKIMSAKTDAGPQKDGHMSPGVDNLFTLLESFADEKVIKKFNLDYHNGELKYSELKAELADAIINTLKPIQAKIAKLEKDKDKVKKILADGAQKAQKIAEANMLEIKEKMGLI
jgi:tryptophanyl-tRNA synthetase